MAEYEKIPRKPITRIDPGSAITRSEVSSSAYSQSPIPEEILEEVQERAKKELEPRDFGSVFTLTNGKGEALDISVDTDKWPSEAARKIGTTLIAEWFGLFLGKNAGYGDAQDTLSPATRVQYLELHRKVGKLKRAFWDNLPIGPEDPREVTMDLIGHCFLLLLAIDGDDDVSS